ncbi:MAG: hypothetical protein AVDCRST_MAG77-5052 [uncultured Chloroflexi bacterium]|uniref:Uncharacterized protein n=1 Tax=uncultured Chloroflexota bacterium TaxID=166587 RepID=A0A6J4K386_9CHLR|nr:MAG: hypothetical protein AVDCRST_MAG77-5052 [uncultured Chloroflexota bacterium]
MSGPSYPDRTYRNSLALSPALAQDGLMAAPQAGAPLAKGGHFRAAPVSRYHLAAESHETR